MEHKIKQDWKDIFPNTKFSKKYHITAEVLNSVTHGLGVVLAIVGTILLLIKAYHNQSIIEFIAYSIYGLGLFVLYLCSTLYHSLTFTRARKVFRVFDHSSIFIVIAASYTPYMLVGLANPLGYTILSIIWIIAFLGVITQATKINKPNRRGAVWLYLLMGWMIIFAIKPITQILDTRGLWLLIAGGLSYSIGIIFYALSKKVKFSHTIWHLFVLAGSITMYLSIYLSL